MAVDDVTSHFSTMLEPITSASFLTSLSIIHYNACQFCVHFRSRFLLLQILFQAIKHLNFFLMRGSIAPVEQLADRRVHIHVFLTVVFRISALLVRGGVRPRGLNQGDLPPEFLRHREFLNRL